MNLGHGGPKSTVQNRLRVVGYGLKLNWIAIIGLAFLYLSGIGLPLQLAFCAEGFDVQVRVLWGGPTNRDYVGAITLLDGHAKNLTPISMQADSSHTVVVKDSRTIDILPSSPTRYGGAEFQVIGSDKTKIRISLTDPNQVEAKGTPKVLEVTLAEVLQQNRSLALDNLGSSVMIERPAADRIRPILNRSSMIFAPDEPIPLSCTGHHLGLGDQQALRLAFSLIRSSTGAVVQSHTASVTTDEYGSFAETAPATLYAPREEGVYRIEIRAEVRRMLGSFLSDSAVTRNLEFVVLQSTPVELPNLPWKSLETWEPAAVDALPGNGPKNRDSSTANTTERSRWLGWRNLGNRGGWWNNNGRESARSPMANNTVERGESLMGPSDWYLTPLKIMSPGKPHRVLVRYSCNQPMQLGLTILEPNTEGVLSPLGVNSGVQLSNDDLRQIEGHGETEIIFWPKSSTASLLVTNPDSQHALRLLGYELFAGPEELESHIELSPFRIDEAQPEDVVDSEYAADQDIEQPSPTTTTPPRMAAIYLDKPLLAEYFGGSEVLDEATGRGLYAWQSYYDACKHLVQYIKWSGHNGVILFVAGEGGSLYPSETLIPNPKFDRGRFFADGRDPIQKDVVELLLTMLDREGLHILLGVHFDGAMDTKLIRPANTNDPVELLDIQSRCWSQPNPNSLRQAPRYNPLHDAVRTQITQTLVELVSRYKSHRSLRGVVVEMGGAGHLSFAGDRWGYDAESVRAFAKSLNTQMPNDIRELTSIVQSRLRGAYMQWRATQVTLFLRQVALRLRNERSDLRFVVSTAGLAKQPPAESDFIEWSELWMPADYIALSRGLDLAGLNQVTEIDLLQADVRFPLHSLPQQRWSYGVRDLVANPLAETELPRGGSLLLLPPTSRNWPAVEQQNPLKVTASKVWTFHQVAPHAPSVLSTWCDRLLVDDAWLIASGGWSPNFGTEKWMRDVASRWAQLPPVRLEAANHSLGQPLSNSVVLRTATYQNKTYLLLMNASPWAETCMLEWNKAPIRERVHLVSQTSEAVPESWYNKQWSITLKPFEWQTICIETPDIEVLNWSHQPEEAAIEFAKVKLNDLSERVKRLHTTRLAASASLVNGGFESFSADGKPEGWTHSTLPSTQISQSTSAFRGTSSLRLDNSSGGNAPLWLQSTPLRLPKTGRMAVELWIRKETGTEEPKVRLMLQGRRSDGSRYERSRFLGKSAADAPISDRWETAPLVLLVSDLPTSGIDELRVEIDLIGSGTIYVDEVKTYDVYLHPDERNLIRNEIFAASEPFRDPSLTVQLDEIDRLWKSYWGEYLRRYVPLTTATAKDSSRDESSESRTSTDANSGNKPPQQSSATQQSPGLLRRRLGNLRSGGSTVDR